MNLDKSDMLSGPTSECPDGLKGADAPEERLVMIEGKLVKLKKTLELMKKVPPWTIPQFITRIRIFKEFPWLWALNNSWSCRWQRCAVVNANSRVLGTETNPSCDYWVYVISSSGDEMVQHLGRGTARSRLAPFALRAANLPGQDDFQVAGIVSCEILRTPDKLVGVSVTTVFRPPRHESLHSLCLQVAEE